jgi:hypothetical protein
MTLVLSEHLAYNNVDLNDKGGGPYRINWNDRRKREPICIGI